ncbi:riboflavin synthase [Bdellovibrionota bacterium FG-1]
MFTGIIQKVGTLTQVDPSGPATRLRIATGFTDLQAGESVAINGVCLTVTEFSREGDALFFVSPETLSKTNLGQLSRDSRVNLERALTLGDRLSGHWVQGHVDGVGRLLSVMPQSESFVVHFELPAALARYCVDKGSITLNGVSLTLNSIEITDTAAMIGLTLIPHTWENTQFSSMRPGDLVNIEVDILAKYVENLSKPYLRT